MKCYSIPHLGRRLDSSEDPCSPLVTNPLSSPLKRKEGYEPQPQEPRNPSTDTMSIQA